MADTVRTSDVHEWVDLTEAQLDQDSYTVRGARIIKAGWSLNERYYPDDVLSASAPIWEGVKAYADHPSKEDLRNRPERSVRDLVGVYANPQHRNGATYSDLKVLGEARTWLWPLIQETMSTGTPVVGLSINALGSAKKGEAEGKKGIIVEAITHANSVDVVTTPAAGGGFTALTASDDGWSRAVMGTMTIDELREARPDLIDVLKREWKTTRDSEAITAARAEADTAKEDAARLTEEHRTTQQALSEARQEIAVLKRDLAVDRLLEGKKLPERVRAELRESLLQCATVEAMTETLDRSLKLLGAVRMPVRVTGAGSAAPMDTPAPRKPTNQLAEVFGVPSELARAETVDEFLALSKAKK